MTPLALTRIFLILILVLVCGCPTTTRSTHSKLLPLQVQHIDAIRLGSSTFQDTVTIFGEAKKSLSGEAALALAQSCYRPVNSDDPTRLVLQSGELENTKIIGAFVLTSRPVAFPEYFSRASSSLEMTEAERESEEDKYFDPTQRSRLYSYTAEDICSTKILLPRHP